MNKLLKILSTNARMPVQKLSVMTGLTEEEVSAQIAEYEKSGVIQGYHTLLDEERLGDEMVKAFIELKVTPKHGRGFDEVAQSIAKFQEVESLYLMSGGYDLAVIVTAKSFKDISAFVATRLATLDSVVSTATHFVMTRHKESGIIISGGPTDERNDV